MLKIFYDTKILENVTRMIEFYDKLDFLRLFDSGFIKSTNQIFMNPDARRVLLENLIENISKNEVYQEQKYEDAVSMVTYDFVQFAPQVNEELKFDQLLIVPLTDVYVDPEDNMKKN